VARRTLIQPLIQDMCLGNTADQVAAGVPSIHLVLTKMVEQALIEEAAEQAPPEP
jgi:hypothetical protein